MNEQQIAKTLADSGLFGDFTWSKRPGEKEWHCRLTADECEEIFAEMGLRVVPGNTQWWIERHIEGPRFETVVSVGFYHILPRAKRTLANNAALAWLCGNQREELAETIERWRKNERLAKRI